MNFRHWKREKVKNTFFLLKDEGSSSLPGKWIYELSDLADRMQVTHTHYCKFKGFNIHFLTSPFVLPYFVLSTFVRLSLFEGLLFEQKITQIKFRLSQTFKIKTFYLILLQSPHPHVCIIKTSSSIYCNLCTLLALVQVLTLWFNKIKK